MPAVVPARLRVLVTELRAELDALDASARALRRFGWVVGGVFLGLAGLIVGLRGALGPWSLGCAAAGALLVGAAFVAPARLRPVFRVWMGLAIVLGTVSTRVLLTLVLVGLVWPIALVLRLVGKELMPRGPEAGVPSYWIDRREGAPLVERLRRPY